MKIEIINKTKTTAQIVVKENKGSKTVHVEWTGKVWEDKQGKVYHLKGE